MELMWELPEFARFLDRLAAMGRLILFDKRGARSAPEGQEGAGREHAH